MKEKRSFDYCARFILNSTSNAGSFTAHFYTKLALQHDKSTLRLLSSFENAIDHFRLIRQILNLKLNN
jgi:hypothetical protein